MQEAREGRLGTQASLAAPARQRTETESTQLGEKGPLSNHWENDWWNLPAWKIQYYHIAKGDLLVLLLE